MDSQLGGDVTLDLSWQNQKVNLIIFYYAFVHS